MRLVPPVFSMLVASSLVILAGFPLRGAAPDSLPGSFDRRVLLLSIDGLHAADLANHLKTHTNSPLARLSRTGLNYTEARTVRPSDSFPAFLALITGGSPASTGVWYDDSYDRSLRPAGATNGPPGASIVFNDSIDRDPEAIDGGGIDPEKLPRDPARGGSLIYPHNFLRVNTVFEVVKAAGGRTAFCEKHLSYEIAHGPSGKGVDDLFTPEIASKNRDGVGTTKSVAATENYDDTKVQAILNQINGRDHSGSNPAAVPVLFGMNFQAVSVAQRLKRSVSTNGAPVPGLGGYTDAAGTPGPLLAEALDHTVASIGRILSSLEASGLLASTCIIVVGKHGNSPIDPSRLMIAGRGDRKNPPVDLQALIDPSVAIVRKLTADDVALFWLADQSKADAAAAVLRANKDRAYIQDVFAGESLKSFWNVSPNDPRAPDIIVFPQSGVIYTSSNKKLSEHGGASEDDTHVALLISEPTFRAQTITAPVSTTQVAPTILRLLGLNPLSLQAVVAEQTKPLPGL